MTAPLRVRAVPAPPEPSPVTAAKGAVLRRCSCGTHAGEPECEECRKARGGRLQRAATRVAPGSGVPPIVHEVLRLPGRPLDPGARAFMEPRFGHDFSRVQVHDDTRAAESARAVDALAYTVGPHLVFGATAYRPGTASGRRLLAHELTHVVQQENTTAFQASTIRIDDTEAPEREAARMAEGVLTATSDVSGPSTPASIAGSRASEATIQRYRFGATPPAGAVTVPLDQRARVDAAMRILGRKTSDRRCKEFFKDNCTAGLGTKELETALRDAEIYHVPAEGELFGSSTGRVGAADPRAISYNLTAYRIGRWELAATLLHEMFHTCILGVIPDEEVTAETSVERCHLFSPFILEVTPREGPVGTVVTIRGFQFGPIQEPTDRVSFNGIDAGRADSWVLSNVDSMVRIRIRIPAGATSGPVLVENNGIPSNIVTFTVT